MRSVLDVQCPRYAGSLANETGMDYILDDLPEGYAVFDRPRMNKPEIVGSTLICLIYNADGYSVTGSSMAILLDSTFTPRSISSLTFTT